MSTKALQKQLVAAIAMVLVAAVALGSSTYAWFANNDTVTANGMEVKAVAEGGIEIRYNVLSTASDDGTAYATTASAGMSEATGLRPTSTAATGTGSAITAKWLHASAAAANDEAAKAGTYADLTAAAGWADGVITNDPVTALDGTYYVVKQFNIRSVSATALAKELKVNSVTVTGASGSADLDKSLRVAIACNSQVVVYAPLGGDASNTVGTGVDANGDRSATATVTNLTPTTVGNLFASANETIPAKNTTDTKYGGYDVRVYIYFEGEDSNHYSDHLTNSLDDLDVTVEFKATI